MKRSGLAFGGEGLGEGKTEVLKLEMLAMGVLWRWWKEMQLSSRPQYTITRRQGGLARMMTKSMQAQIFSMDDKEREKKRGAKRRGTRMGDDGVGWCCWVIRVWAGRVGL